MNFSELHPIATAEPRPAFVDACIRLGGLRKGLVQPPCEIACADVGVASEHPQIPVAGDCRQFEQGDRDSCEVSAFRDAADRFVPQVMQVQIFDTGPIANPVPSAFEFVERQRKYPGLRLWQRFQSIDHALAKRDSPIASILRFTKQG